MTLGQCKNEECKGNLWQDAGQPEFCDTCLAAGADKKKGKAK